MRLCAAPPLGIWKISFGATEPRSGDRDFQVPAWLPIFGSRGHAPGARAPSVVSIASDKRGPSVRVYLGSKFLGTGGAAMAKLDASLASARKDEGLSGIRISAGDDVQFSLVVKALDAVLGAGIPVIEFAE